MGIIENKTFKNIFSTSEKESDKLTIYMESNCLCEDLFKLKSEKPSIKNIDIFCIDLEQKDFNNLINQIKNITDKPICISFSTNKNYNAYVSSYKGQYDHFPDNIFIRSTLVELDDKKNNLIKKKSI